MYCERCNKTQAWRLGDGRYKCRNCGYRYSWTSAWDAVRLPAAAKDQLLEAFVLGLPSYRQRFLSPVNAKTRERFYRICRACCADAEQVRQAFSGVPVGTSGQVMLFELTQQGEQVRASPVAAQNVRELLGRISQPEQPAGLIYAGAQRAYVALPLRRNYVVWRPRNTPVHGINRIEDFWTFAQHWLQPYHALPQPYFHLYLGEVCYRFNRREQDLKPLLQQLLQERSIQELRPLLVGSWAELPREEKPSAGTIAAAHFLGVGRLAGHPV